MEKNPDAPDVSSRNKEEVTYAISSQISTTNSWTFSTVVITQAFILVFARLGNVMMSAEFNLYQHRQGCIDNSHYSDGILFRNV